MNRKMKRTVGKYYVNHRGAIFRIDKVGIDSYDREVAYFTTIYKGAYSINELVRTGKVRFEWLFDMCAEVPKLKAMLYKGERI